MVMIESLLDATRATNDRLGRSMDEFLAKLADARDWARTAGYPSPSPESSDERPFRPGAARCGPL